MEIIAIICISYKSFYGIVEPIVENILANNANAFSIYKRRCNTMANKSNRINVPEARTAMDRFKMESAADLRVPVPS